MTLAKFRITMDTRELNAMIEKVESTPRAIAAHLRKTAIPKASAMLTDAWRSEVPVADPDDLAKQSKKHKQAWAKVPPVYSSIDTNVRHWDRVNSSFWVGPRLMDTDGKSPGNKLFFDYMGTTDRMMSFWSGPSGGPKRYRARRKTKDWIAKRINDTVTPSVVSMMIDELQKGFQQEFRK